MKFSQKAFLQAIELSTKLSQVMRSVGYTDTHCENDAEHSYQVAIVAWALNSQYNLKLDVSKILKVALVHDLVEVYAGDVDAHSNKSRHLTKKENERIALLHLQKDYSELKEIINEIDEYEKKESLEVHLVSIADKIIPIRHVYNCNGNYYKKRKVTLDEWLVWLYTKVNYEELPSELKVIVDETVLNANTTYKSLFYSSSDA